jgi:hypothetical protein
MQAEVKKEVAKSTREGAGTVLAHSQTNAPTLQ